MPHRNQGFTRRYLLLSDSDSELVEYGIFDGIHQTRVVIIGKEHVENPQSETQQALAQRARESKEKVVELLKID